MSLADKATVRREVVSAQKQDCPGCRSNGSKLRHHGNFPFNGKVAAFGKGAFVLHFGNPDVCPFSGWSLHLPLVRFSGNIGGNFINPAIGEMGCNTHRGARTEAFPGNFVLFAPF